MEGADVLRPGVKGDQPLLLRKPTTEIVMPEITRTLADFQSLASKHSVSLVRITIQELMDELAKRGRLLAGDSVGADVVMAPLESSVMTGFRRELIALMTLSLYFFGNTEFCIHVHILHLQIFNRDDSQNNEVDLENQGQIINSFALSLLFTFHQCPKFKS